MLDDLLPDAASPLPRLMSVDAYQVKQLEAWFALRCCGYNTTNWCSSASAFHPATSIAAAVCVHPCKTTTSGRPLGRPAGTYSNMSSAPTAVSNFGSNPSAASAWVEKVSIAARNISRVIGYLCEANVHLMCR